MFRLFTICSNWQLIHSEIEHLRSVMRRNAYPDNLLNNVIKRFLARLYVVKNSERDVKDTRTFQIYLPYLGPLTAKTEQSINRLFRQYMPKCKVKVIAKATVRLSSLFSFKDKIPRYLTSGVV